MLKGKQGRFRQNLLGKRVDYSGRSVIVVGPDLKIYQCGVPKEMAIELFRPFVMKKLVEDGVANNIKSAKKMVDKQRTEVWDALDVVIKEHPVLLNRAPTLHRLGIQAFEPILVEGRALRLHPLVCTAYNADFDGDQMAIHVPLSAEAQAEARILMLSANNLLRPQDGHPVTVPTQDMILGSYYLTYLRLGKAEKGAERVFVTDAGDTGLPVGEVVDADEFVAANKAAKKDGGREAEYRPLHAYVTSAEAIMAYNSGAIGLHAPILVRVEKTVDGVPAHRLIRTTVGRIIFNEPIPQDLGYVDRSDPEHAFDHEISFQVGKKQLGDIIDRCIQKYGFTISAEVLDNIKALGFKYSTIGALTISIADMTVPDTKQTLIEATEKKVLDIEKQYRRGFITNDERYRLVVDEWEQTTKDVTGALQNCLDEYNPIYMMANSGARGSMNQIRQLAGMRGLMANTAGKTIEIPIKANFREGLSVLEYFISSRGARKGLADTALRTADSGYLTRRLVDVSQDVIIREEDCGTHDGIWASAVYEKGQEVQSFAVSISGRFPAEPITDPATGEVLFGREHMLQPEDAEVLAARGIERVRIRSVLTCEARSGVCAKCYGINLAVGQPVNPGEAVGVIAAQSIGEPGTQLTMRTFHTGGIAGDDITQGLPRVEELFEARKPKRMATLSEISGTVSLEETRKNAMFAITVTNEAEGDTRVYTVPFSAGILVAQGDHVDKGQELTSGALNPHDVLRIRGIEDDEFGPPGRAQLPHPGGTEGLPPAGRRYQRQAHRGHRAPDDAQGARGGGGRHRAALRRDGRYLRAEGRQRRRRRPQGGRRAPRGRQRALRRHLYAAADGHHQGLAGHGQLPLRRFLPGDDQGADRRRHQGQGGPSGGPEGERHNRQAHPRGSGLSLYRNVKSEMDEEAGSEPEDYVDLSVLVNRSNAL